MGTHGPVVTLLPATLQLEKTYAFLPRRPFVSRHMSVKTSRHSEIDYTVTSLMINTTLGRLVRRIRIIKDILGCFLLASLQKTRQKTSTDTDSGGELPKEHKLPLCTFPLAHTTSCASPSVKADSAVELTGALFRPGPNSLSHLLPLWRANNAAAGQAAGQTSITAVPAHRLHALTLARRENEKGRACSHPSHATT